MKSVLVRRLKEDPYTSEARIRVDVSGRVATLRGVVDSDEARQAADHDAHEVPGVIEVSNELEVARAA